LVTGVQTCALPIYSIAPPSASAATAARAQAASLRGRPLRAVRSRVAAASGTTTPGRRPANCRKLGRVSVRFKNGAAPLSSPSSDGAGRRATRLNGRENGVVEQPRLDGLGDV